MTNREKANRRSGQTIGRTMRRASNPRHRFHQSCFACGSTTFQGLRLQFRQDGLSIRGTTIIRKSFQSYDGIAHGGIVTTLLDAAMVRCLHNVYRQEPFTCKLDVRFRLPVPTNVPVGITARIMAKRNNRCSVAAEIRIEENLHAHADGVFMLR